MLQYIVVVARSQKIDDEAIQLFHRYWQINGWIATPFRARNDMVLYNDNITT